MSGDLVRDLTTDASIAKILALRWSAMGDVALASAGFEDLHRAFPGRELHLNTMPPWDRLFAHDPRFAKVHAIAFKRGGRRLAGVAEWLGAIGAEGFDLVVDFQSTDRARILLTLLSVKGRAIRWRVGNRRDRPYNSGPRKRPEPLHALDRIRFTLASCGVAAASERPVLHPGPGHRERARRWRREHGLDDDGYAVFLPGSQAAGHLKRWGAGNFADLGVKLRASGVERVLILGGPDEVDECAAIAARLGDLAVNLCGRTELLEIVPLCEGARVIVANDTGTAHVASATARPMIVICGPTDPRKVLPAGPNVRALQADLPCINCYRKLCDHHSCMKVMTPDVVMRAVAEAGAR